MAGPEPLGRHTELQPSNTLKKHFGIFMRPPPIKINISARNRHRQSMRKYFSCFKSALTSHFNQSKQCRVVQCFNIGRKCGSSVLAEVISGVTSRAKEMADISPKREETKARRRHVHSVLMTAASQGARLRLLLSSCHFLKGIQFLQESKQKPKPFSSQAICCYFLVKLSF